MNNLLENPFFGIVLSIFAYEIGVLINKKLKSPLANPLLISIIIVIIILKTFNISFEAFNKGGMIITMMLAPATASLGLSIYTQLDKLKKNFLPIIIGTAVGSLTSILSVIALCRVFALDQKIVASLIPKSVTTPIAIEVSNSLGGIAPIAVAGVLITGVFGAMTAPMLVKMFNVKNDVVAGIAIGTSSHAAGTSKAVEMGEVIGAMSGIAIGIAGLFTVIYSLFI